VLRELGHQQQVAYVMAVPVDLPLVGVRGEALRPVEADAVEAGLTVDFPERQ
jgi:hypothetical protein